MAAENCSRPVLQLDPYSWSAGGGGGGGGHWGLSNPDLLAFETDALVRVLAGSTLPNPDLPFAAPDTTTPSSSSLSSTFFPCSPSQTASNSAPATPASSSAGSPFLPSHSACPTRPAVAAGRVSKRKPRRAPQASASRRAAISYIETDPARFRDMVQLMTGFGVATPAPAPAGAQMQMQMPPYQPAMPTPMMQMNNNGYQQASVAGPMPTLDTSAGLLNTVAAPIQLQQEQILSAPGFLDNPFDLLLGNFDFGDDLLMMMPEFPQQQQQQPMPLPPCFPTLESGCD